MSRPPRAREPLREAALRLFVEGGIHATGVREIARSAGVTEAAVYRHWKNKDDLVVQLYHDHLVEVVALIDEAIATKPGLHDRLLAATVAAYALYDAKPLVFRFILFAQHEMAARVDPSWRMPQDVVALMIRDAIAAGESRGDPQLLSAAALGIFLQTATSVIYGRLPGPLSRHAAAVADLIYAAVTAKPSK